MITVKSFEAFGTSYKIRSDRSVDEDWLERMLPGFEDPGPKAECEKVLEIVTLGNVDQRGLYYEGEMLCAFGGFDNETAQGFEGNLQFVFAMNAADEFVFVHAGAVSLFGRGLLLPARSGSGKSTLTKALLELGAEYLSDDCAIIDPEGFVHPYPTPLKIRTEDGSRKWLKPEEDGFQRAAGPVPVGCVLLTKFEARSVFEPSQISQGRASMGILDSLFLPSAIRESPRKALAAIERAVAGAILLEGPRGEAQDAAELIFSRMEARFGKAI